MPLACMGALLCWLGEPARPVMHACWLWVGASSFRLDHILSESCISGVTQGLLAPRAAAADAEAMLDSVLTIVQAQGTVRSSRARCSQSADSSFSRLASSS